MTTAHVEFSFHAETVIQTATLEVEGKPSPDEVHQLLEDWLQDVHGIDPDQPDGSINDCEVAYGKVEVIGVTYA